MLYFFLVRFIGLMFYTGNIHLADVLIYICVYCTCQLKINRYLRALQSVTADFCEDRLFSRFSPYGCSRSGTLGTV